MHNSTYRNFKQPQICPRCLTIIDDEFVTQTPDGPIHEACEKLPRPSKQQRKQSTGATRAAAALTRNKRLLG